MSSGRRAAATKRASLADVPGAPHHDRGRRRLLAAALALLVPSVIGAAPAVRAIALFKNRAVLSIDGRNRSLAVGQVSPEGVHLLAADATGARIVIDGVEHQLALDSRIHGAFASAPAPPVVRLLPGAGGHYFADGQINGNPVRFVVDTGATDVAMNKHVARRLGIAYLIDGDKGLVQTAAGVATAYAVMLNEVKVHAIALARVRGTVIDGDYPSDILLGQSFLNRLDIHRAGAVLELRAR